MAAGKPAAAVAHQHRRVAAPVDEDEALLAAPEPLGDRFEQPRGEPVAAARAASSGDAFDAGRPRVDALGQLDERVAPARRVVIALERRRRRPEDDRHPALARAHDGQVARRVAEAFGLLERGVVLFVDDDQPQLRAAARTPRAACRGAMFARARLRGQPVAQPLALVQAAVQRRRAACRESAPAPSLRAAA